jgi:trans-2,3-dihydro-3-hydroxyanthranilate isomerase
MFAPGMGIWEDPATGGASGPLGCYLVRRGGIGRDGGEVELVSEQGIEMGRPSFIRIRIAREGEEITGVRVGGECRFMGEGYLEVED